MSYATKEQLAELATYMASQIRVPTIGIGGGYAPIGTIISYMGTSAPQDYLACDGSVVNIADYPQLADFFESQFGSKNYFGGDGTTTFAVPDLRGEFLRGTGTNSHTDQGNGANVGTHQDEGLPNITGWVGDVPSGDSAGAFRKDAGGTVHVGVGGGTAIFSTMRFAASWFNALYGKSSHNTPTNTSVLYCIKAVVAGDVYSTEERVVGTWLDGKPIYQKTVTVNITAGAAKSTKDYTLTTDATYELRGMEGLLVRTGGNGVSNTMDSIVISQNDGTVFYSFYLFQNAEKNIILRQRAYETFPNGGIGYITLRYTKTTD